MASDPKDIHNHKSPLMSPVFSPHHPPSVSFGGSNSWNDAARVSLADKKAMHGGHIPSFMYHGKKPSNLHGYNTPPIGLTAGHKIQKTPLKKQNFTPRAQDIKKTHYTPDWFKISIRTVDRDNIHESDEETKIVTAKIQEVCKLRDKWLYSPSTYDESGCILEHGEISLDYNKMDKENTFPSDISNKYSYKCIKGVIHITNNNTEHEEFIGPSFDEYLYDLRFVMDLVSNGPAKTMCYRRLKILQSRFTLHLWLNDHIEVCEVKSVPHRDFYNVRKIDNHVHHSACMHQKHLLRFIKRKLNEEGDVVVFETKKDKKKQTLKEVFEEIGLSANALSIDSLDMHAHQQTFHRFDKFNAKYNPIGKAQLRTIFLKIDNYLKGRYLAEITKEVSTDLEQSKYQFAEYRLSIYGKKKAEWDILAHWICDNNLYSENVRWLIQMPRIYGIFKKIGIPSIKSFNDMLDNFFAPLFEVTLNPKSHRALHCFLQIIVGFDSVDDESAPEQKRRRYPDPEQWTMKENPPYIYYMYYTYINVVKLNKLREERGLNTFAFRPHCGEAGSFDHLASCFLLAQSINHGIVLKQSPVLQYLYYLKQIGLAMSPLSNNILFKEYDQNPFPGFFKRGLNVALSTDDPLLIHYTKDALLEEYSIAAQVYNLSSIDLCELAYNSVKQSGFDYKFKQHCIGQYKLRGSAGNDIYQSNVPDARLELRKSILEEEENFIKFAGYPQELMRRHSMASAANHHFNMMNDQFKSQEFLGGFPIESDEDNAVTDELKVDSPAPNSVESPMAMPPSQRPPNMKRHRSVFDIVQREQSFIMTKKNQTALYAEKLATDTKADITKEPPHAQWMQLAEEKKRLEIIREELTKWMDLKKQQNDNMDPDDYGELTRILTGHNKDLAKARKVIMAKKTNNGTDSSPPIMLLQAKTSIKLDGDNSLTVEKMMENATKNKSVLENEKNKKNLLELREISLDIRGYYFNDSEQIQEINKDFQVIFDGSSTLLKMEAGHKKQRKYNENITKLRCDLQESKQLNILDDPVCAEVAQSELFDLDDNNSNNNTKIVSCYIESATGELIWNNGVVWFKKSWSILVGAWEDSQNNLIEIKKDNTLRYISGYGPFNGEFIGFKKLHIKLPNNQYITAELLNTQELKWETGEKWKRCTDKGCSIM